MTFRPTSVGQVGAVLRFRFKNTSPKAAPIPPLELPLRAVGGDIPVVLENDLLDLRCCVYGQVYAADLLVTNRARAAMKASVVIPDHLSQFVQIHPDAGFVQGTSTMAFRLTFKPQPGLLDKAGRRAEKIAGSSTEGSIRLPLKVRVLDQALPLPFTVQAMLTTSELQILPPSLDFGLIPVGEFSSLPLKLHNASRLPIKFGMQRHKGFMFRPNGGFGSLLPGEDTEVEVCFNPPTTGKHQLEVECKTLLGRTFAVPCKATAYRPAIALSANRITFRSTELGSTATETVFLRNSSDEEQLFHFVMPKGLKDVVVTPQVGSLQPHSTVRVQLNFLPQIGEDTPPQELWDPMSDSKGEVDGLDEPIAEADEADGDGDGGRGVAFDLPSRPKTPELGGESPTLWCRRQDWLIPCFIKSRTQANAEAEREAAAANQGAGGAGDAAGAEKLPAGLPSQPTATSATKAGGVRSNLDFAPPVQRIHLQVSTSAVVPRLMLHGKSLTWHPERGYYQLHFGQIPVGQRVVMTVSLRNNTPEEHDVTSTALDPNGPFQILNPLRVIEPYSGDKLLFEFKPKDEGPQTDVMVLSSLQSGFKLRVMGEGISPDIEVDCAEVDCGDLLRGAKVTKPFTITNHGQFPIRLMLPLRSLALRTSGVLPPPTDESDPEFRTNVNGGSPFLVCPSEATLPPGDSTTVEVTFMPDHQYMFDDLLDIMVPNQPDKLTLKLRGRCWEKGVFLLGFDRVKSPADPTFSTRLRPPVAVPSNSEPVRRVTLQPERIFSGQSAEARIVVGNLAGNGAQPGEYAFNDLSQAAKDRGWSIDNPKEKVAPGARQTVVIRYRAPSSPSPSSLTYYGEYSGDSTCHRPCRLT